MREEFKTPYKKNPQYAIGAPNVSIRLLLKYGIAKGDHQKENDYNRGLTAVFIKNEKNKIETRKYSTWKN